ncbi:MAG: HAD family hydrolase [bacterium]
MTASNWQPTAVVFDMDGLLVDTNPIWREAERGLIESRGRPFSSEVRQQIMGLRMRDIVARFKEIYDLEDPLEQLRQELAQRLSQLVLEGVTPQPGAHELLAYLQQSDLPLAVASSSPPALIDGALETNGWDRYFLHRCSAEDEAHGKPAPDVYLRAAERLGVAPAACLALEDTPTGARAAVAAGMVCYAVSATQPASRFAGVTEHHFTTLHEVLDTLKNA